MRRQFWETIVDAVSAVQVPDSAQRRIRVTDVRLSLPMEISTPQTEAGFRVYADLPRGRWREGLAPPPHRVRMHLAVVPAVPLPAAANTGAPSFATNEADELPSTTFCWTDS